MAFTKLNSERLFDLAENVRSYHYDIKALTHNVSATRATIDWEVQAKAGVDSDLQSIIKLLKRLDDETYAIAAAIEHAAVETKNTNNKLVSEIEDADEFRAILARIATLGALIFSPATFWGVGSIAALFGLREPGWVSGVWAWLKELFGNIFGSDDTVKPPKETPADTSKTDDSEKEQEAQTPPAPEATDEIGAFNRDEDLVFENRVERGKIRYIAQQDEDGVAHSGHFSDDYWQDGFGNDGCNAASISMVMSYFGIDFTPKQMRELALFDSTNFCAGGSSLVAATVTSETGIGVSTVFDDDVDIKSLNSAIQSFETGNGDFAPPIVVLENSAGDKFHWVVVTGNNGDGTYSLIDPWCENNKTLRFTNSGGIVFGDVETRGIYKNTIQYRLN